MRGNGTFDVYFPEDRQVDVLERKDLKHVGTPIPYWARMTRDNYVSMTFKHIATGKDARDSGCTFKQGEYKVLAMGQGENINKYICKYENMLDARLKRKKPKTVDENEYMFDMGYVQRILMHEIFPFGPDTYKPYTDNA